MTGKTISHYRILEKLGEGGMGVVYRAQDTRLGRDVAIKVLPESFARDPERLARFEREARLLASLNHPNIAAIHGLEEHDGLRYLVPNYDVSSDGQSFVMIKGEQESAPAQLNIVLNWFEELKRRVPTGKK